MRKYVLIAVSLLTALIVFWGCDNRGTGIPTGTVEDWGIDPLAQHSYDTLLALQLRNPSELLLGTRYLPREAAPPPHGTSQPTPVLILLAPEGGNKFYYWDHGLQRLMEEMVASGEIEPMIIQCVANDPVFGTYFYGNSAPAGNYDGIIGDRLIHEYINNFIPSAIVTQQSKIGIGGIGTGAYGALRAAILHPGTFGSITVADGPLDFDGATGTSGLLTTFPQALAEQGLTNASNAAFRAGWDSSSAYPLSRLLTGGSLAFSPHDTTVGFLRLISGNPPKITVQVTTRSSINSDSSSYITGIITEDEGNFDFHLPFDQTGNAVPLIWNLWMRNNLDSLFERQGGNPLTGAYVHVSTSPSAPFNYSDMTQAWVASARAQGVNVKVHEYGGYPGGPEGQDAYLYDIMRVMLKFHNARFTGQM